MKKTITALTMVLLMVISVPFAFAGDSKKKSPKAVAMNMGSTKTSSGFFVFAATLARIINKNCPEIKVTLIESGAGYDNIKRVKEGIFDFACTEIFNISAEAYHGLPPVFEGKPWKETRIFAGWKYGGMLFYVYKNSGINNIADLAGKKLCPGIPGSATHTYAIETVKTLGLPIKVVPSSFTDGIKSMKDGRIHSIAKGSPKTYFDVGMMQVHMFKPITVIGLSGEQKKRLKAVYPLWEFIKIKPGTYREAPEAGNFWSRYYLLGGTMPSTMSQELGYKIVKAYMENWAALKQSYPDVEDFDPVNDVIGYFTDPKWACPFHAGLVQYMEEKGAKVPDYLIPPEYRRR